MLSTSTGLETASILADRLTGPPYTFGKLGVIHQFVDYHIFQMNIISVALARGIESNVRGVFSSSYVCSEMFFKFDLGRVVQTYRNALD